MERGGLEGGGYVKKKVLNPQDDNTRVQYKWVEGPGGYIKMSNGFWTWKPGRGTYVLKDGEMQWKLN